MSSLRGSFTPGLLSVTPETVAGWDQLYSVQHVNAPPPPSWHLHRGQYKTTVHRQIRMGGGGKWATNRSDLPTFDLKIAHLLVREYCADPPPADSQQHRCKRSQICDKMYREHCSGGRLILSDRALRVFQLYWNFHHSFLKLLKIFSSYALIWYVSHC